MSLTERSIAALKPPEHGQHLHADGLIPGFGVRVSQGGAKTFVLVLGTERQKITIGHYPVVSLAQARNKAKTILAQRQLGLDKPLSPFFKDVEEGYRIVRDKTLGSGTLRKDPLFFEAFAGLSRKRIADINPSEVQRMLDAVEAPSSRIECFIRFKGLIRFAVRRGYIETWPMERLEVSKPHFARDRVLNTDELRAILLTARLWSSVGHPFGAIVELLILTGQRRQQIGSLERSHVDFDAGTIKWPAELMKAKRSHTIPIGSLVQILREHGV
jgi:integrase